MAKSLNISILAQEVSSDKYTVIVNRESVINNIWVNQIVIKLENLSVENHIIKVTLYDQSHNLISQELRVDVVLTTTISVEQVNSIFELDSCSSSFLVFILSIVMMIIAVRRIRSYRRKKS
ncbi:MAG: hypothetical protein ACXADW_00260 [Candidatus Hodarchaeales archaeon]|jgi:hypothetical protein